MNYCDKRQRNSRRTLSCDDDGVRVDRSIGPIVELNCWHGVVLQSHWVVGEHL